MRALVVVSGPVASGKSSLAEPLDLGGPTRVVDTTRPVDLDEIDARVRSEIR